MVAGVSQPPGAVTRFGVVKPKKYRSDIQNVAGRCLFSGMKNTIKRFAMCLARLSVPNNNGQPSEIQSPIGVSSFVCFVSLAFICWVARHAVWLLQVWWAELLVYALIPISVTFIILYRSCWHREITGAARTLLLILLSCIIFAGVFTATGIIIILASMVYYSSIANFGAFHY